MVNASDPPSKPLSKYAKKVAERQAGIRPEFQFIDMPEKGNVEVSKPSKDRDIESANSQEKITVKARVEKRFPGCIFLRTIDGTSIYMGLNVLQKSQFKNRVNRKTTLECVVEPHPNGKGPRVKEILSIDE